MAQLWLSLNLALALISPGKVPPRRLAVSKCLDPSPTEASPPLEVLGEAQLASSGVIQVGRAGQGRAEGTYLCEYLEWRLWQWRLAA